MDIVLFVDYILIVFYWKLVILICPNYLFEFRSGFNSYFDFSVFYAVLLEISYSNLLILSLTFFLD